jgi:EmrB/QacA subfamily drug resistance transporter
MHVAIPTMMASLGATLDQIQWVLTAYTIVQTVLIPSVGWLGDRLGDRNLFLGSLAVFTAGSLLCSVSWDAGSLISFRVVQAIGAGPLMGVSMSLMYTSFPPQQRGLAMGLFMTGWAIGPFFGPLVGGYLTEHVNWRAIFYLNFPAGLAALVAGSLLLPRKAATQRRTAFDLGGFLTLTGGTVALLLALTRGQEWGWTSGPVVGLFFSTLLFLSLFLWIELRSRNPFVQLRHFRSFNFSLANLIIFFRVAGFRGGNFLVALFLQRGLHYAPMQAGLFLLPGAVITATLSPLAGIASDRFNPRVPVFVGLLVLVGALYGLSQMTLWTTMAMIFSLIALKSVGQSLLNGPLNTIALNALPEGETRMGSGIMGLVRGLGDAFGIACVTVLLERYTFLNLGAMSPAVDGRLSGPVRDETLSQMESMLLGAGERLAGVADKATSLLGYSLINQAVTQSYHDLFFMIGTLYFVMIWLVPLLRSEAAGARARAGHGGAGH